jgi:CBS domain-containing protein
MFEKRRYLGIITGEVITAGQGATAVEIAKLMKDNDIGIIVIMDGDTVVGTVSERDIVRSIGSPGKELGSVKAGDIMTKEVVSIEIKEGMNRIYQALMKKKFRHLLVFDNRKLVGITSRRDLLDVITSQKR